MVFSRGTNDDYDDDHDRTRMIRIKRIIRILKTPGYVALIAKPERGPNP